MNKEDFKDMVYAFKQVLEGRDGKKIDELLKFVCRYEQDYTTNDALELAKLVGKRSVYITLKSMIKNYDREAKR